jgi:hypothetical protein
LLAAALALAAILTAVPAATSAVPADSTALRAAVTTTGILKHEQKFNGFAQDSVAAFGHPTRVDGSVGFTKSVNYVVNKLTSYGYTPVVQNFTFDRFEETAAPVFEQTAPNSKTYSEGTDFLTMDYSGSGNVTALVVPTTDVDISAPGGSTSGCETSDFTSAVSGKIALIQRGTCTFRQKADNAQAAGAIGVIIFNEGNAGRTDVFGGTLSPPQMTLPVIGTSFAVGKELYQTAGATVHIAVQAHVLTTQSANVTADTGGRADRTVVVGGHLDSVEPGPGAATTGLRRAELLALRWQDVDFAGSAIAVRESKTDAGERRVPMFGSARRLLLEGALALQAPRRLRLPDRGGDGRGSGRAARREFYHARRGAKSARLCACTTFATTPSPA